MLNVVGIRKGWPSVNGIGDFVAQEEWEDYPVGGR
jgi:hypothetical protein